MVTLPLRHGWVSGLGSCGLLLLLAVVPLGCSGRGTVSGRVLFNGKPLPGGLVKFIPVDARSNPVTATIGEDGSYAVTVPAGAALISVDNRALKNPNAVGSVGVGGEAAAGTKGGPPRGAPVVPPKDMMAKMKEEHEVPAPTGTTPVGTYMPIPDKYYDPETSGLKYNVQGGSQTHDIELTK
jgi:hypothetical protein